MILRLVPSFFHADTLHNNPYPIEYITNRNTYTYISFQFKTFNRKEANFLALLYLIKSKKTYICIVIKQKDIQYTVIASKRNNKHLIIGETILKVLILTFTKQQLSFQFHSLKEKTLGITTNLYY